MREAPQLEPTATQQELDDIEDAANDVHAADDEFMAQWGLGAVNAHWAYARGATGNDVTIGVIDNGLDHLHTEVLGRVRGNSILLHPEDTIAVLTTVTSRPPYPTGDQVDYTLPGPPFLDTGHTYPSRENCPGETRGKGPFPVPVTEPICQYLTEEDSSNTIRFYRIPFVRETEHGLGTVSVAVANKDETDPISGGNIHGVAYNANVHFSIKHVLLGLGGISPDTIADTVRLLRPMVDAKIPVVNMSFGIPLRRIDDPEVGISSSLARLLEQSSTPRGERTIFVWSAGNDNGDPCTDTRLGCTSIGGAFDAAFPSPEGGYPYLRPALRGHSLTVAATTEAGGIADFSNRCGSLPTTGPTTWDAAIHGRHYCLAAPGEDILLPLPRGLQRISTVESPCSGSACRYLKLSGTSFSAPHVTGAIAVLIEFFTGDDDYQNVGNTAIVHRVLETANRKGIYAGVDNDDCVGTRTSTGGVLECTGDAAYTKTYGAGLLDLKAATEPDGMAMMTMGTSLDGPAVPLSQTRLFAGPAYGDAFSRAFANTRVAAFDSMLFPFWHPLTSLVDSPPRRNIHYHRARFSPPSRIATHLPGVGTFRLGVKTLPPIPRRAFRRPDATDPARRRPSSLSFRRETASGSVFAAWRSPGSTPLSLRETLPTPLSSEAFTHPFMSFADNGISVGVRAGALTAAAFTDPDAPSPVHGMALDYALLPYLSVQAGMVSEKGGALGLRPAGAFGGLSTTSTAFTGLKLDAPVSPRWRVLSHAHFGTARPDVSGIGLVKEVSPLLVSAVSVGIAGRGVLTDGDSLTLALSQPLRVERGRVSLVVPTGRTPAGDLRRVGIDAGLAPSGREVAVSAAWTAAVGRAAYVRLAAGASREPGHDASADNAFHALADVSFRF